MKKFLAILALTLGIFAYSNVNACSTCNNSCDQTFYFKLRQGKTYNFGDIFNNKSSKTLKISSAAAVFNESEDFNWSSSDSKFIWTQAIKNQKGIVNPYQSLKILETSNTYKVLYYPSKWRKKDNIKIKYTVNYKNNDWGDNSKKHTECANYEITWCGDGIVDSGYGEKCDPNDTSKQGWWSGWCNVITCQPIENKQATCNAIKVDSKWWTAPINKVITCEWSNVKKFKLDCGNGQIFYWNWNNNWYESFTKTCNYNTWWSYQATCEVNDQITNSNCTTNFTLEKDNWSIDIIKTDLNNVDIDWVVGNDTQTIIKWDESVFKIVVKNNGNRPIKGININDSLVPNCAWMVVFPESNTYTWVPDGYKKVWKYSLPKTFLNFQIYWEWNHNNFFLDPGEIFSYTCKKENTYSSYTNNAQVVGSAVTKTWDYTYIKDESNRINLNDSDSSLVKVVDSKCTWLTSDKYTWAIDFTANLKCTWTNTNKYKIVVTSPNWIDTQVAPMNTAIFNFNKVGTYTAKCFVEDRNETENVCIKTIVATVKPVPAITVDKVDANSNDRDNIVWNDTQTVLKWNKAVFKIKITNSGNENLKDVVLTDVIAPNCSKTSSESLALIKNTWNKDSIFNVWESFEYTCEKPNANDSYTNTISVNAKGQNSNKPVNDTDNTKVLVVEPTCSGLTIDKDNGKPSFVSNFVCSWVNNDSYKIVIKNEAWEIIKTINSNLGQYTFTTEWKYSVECYMNDEITTPEICKKSVVVNDSNTPSIKLDKIDANIIWEKDWTVGNDTQTVLKNTDAVFKIKVTNNGTEDLKEVNITDAIAPNCSWTYTLPTEAPATWEGLSLAWEGDHTDNLFNPGEIFEYICKKTNTLDGYTNTATVNAKGNISNVEVNSTDTTVVKVINPSILLEKLDANTADIDSNVGNDTQTVLKWNKAVFKIKVTNNWIEDLKELNITDTIAPACDWVVNLSNKKIWENNLTFTWSGNHNDNLFQVGEVFEYTCEKANSQNDYTNSATVNAKGNTSNVAVNSTDTTVVKVKETISCNWLTASPSSAKNSLTSTVVCTWTNVSKFKIDCWVEWQVYTQTGSNNGSETFTKTCTYKTIWSYVPKCYINDTITNNSCSKTVSVTSGWHSSWEAKCYDIKKNLKDITCIWNSKTKKLKVDCGNGTVLESSDLDKKWLRVSHKFTCDYADDEIDTYEPTCYVAKYNLWKTNSACEYKNNSFCWDWKINIPNSAWLNEQCEKVIVQIWMDSDWEWSVKTAQECRDANWTVSQDWKSCDLGFPENCKSCKLDIHWWSSASCYEIKKTGNTITCTWNSRAKQFKVDCGNGKLWVEKTEIIRNSNWRNIQSFTCDYTNNPRTSNIICAVNKSTSSTVTNGWKTSNACLIEKGSYKPATEPTYSEILTFPNHWELILTPAKNILIWDGDKVFNHVSKPYIKNKSDYSLHLKELCLVITDSSSLKWNLNTRCQNLPDILYPGESRTLNEDLGNIIWDTSKFNWDYDDNVLSTTISIDGRNAESLANAFFAAKLNVRVAKPAVVTTWGWTSYINWNLSSNIQNIARNNSWEDYANRDSSYNYVWTSVNWGNDSSFTNSSNNTSVTNTTDNSNINDNSTINNITSSSDWNILQQISSDISSFKKYNWISNVYILEWFRDFRIDSNTDLSHSHEARTYIINNWNLYINSNFNQNENIAFVVKWWNIIIDKNVEKIKWTFIVIPDSDWNWWKIKSNWKTNKQIVINGSVYWDISDLVKDRTYIKNEWNDQLWVWTIVSFGSSIFRKPAPLVSNFIKDYMNTVRVAQ